MVIVFPKTNTACQTDENGLKPGSNLNIADTHVAEHSKAGWGRSFLSVAWPTGVQLMFFFCLRSK